MVSSLLFQARVLQIRLQGLIIQQINQDHGGFKLGLDFQGFIYILWQMLGNIVKNSRLPMFLRTVEGH